MLQLLAEPDLHQQEVHQRYISFGRLNAVMGIRYVIRVNSVLISLSDSDALPPNAAMVQEFVNALPQNNFENFLFCGVIWGMVANMWVVDTYFDKNWDACMVDVDLYENQWRIFRSYFQLCCGCS